MKASITLNEIKLAVPTMECSVLPQPLVKMLNIYHDIPIEQIK